MLYLLKRWGKNGKSGDEDESQICRQREAKKSWRRRASRAYSTISGPLNDDKGTAVTFVIFLCTVI